jgi:hypothetical protein
MAKVLYTVPVQELTGSVAGVTFQRNASGFIARSKPNKKVNPSGPQTAAQINYSSIINAWQSLPVNFRESWNLLAADQPHVTPWGQLRNLNGFQQFLSNNLIRKSLNLDVLQFAPSYNLPAQLSNFEVNFGHADIILTLIDPAPVAPYQLQIFATPPLRRSAPLQRQYNYLLSGWQFSDPSTINLTSVYCTQFNLNYPYFINESQCFAIFRLAVVESTTGFRSQFSTFTSQISYI